MVREYVVSLLRTSVVPFIAAWVIHMLQHWNIQWFTDSQILNGTTIVVASIWYAIFRWIEIIAKKPLVKKIAGILLGYPRVNVKA